MWNSKNTNGIEYPKKKKKLCSCRAHKYMLLFPTDRTSRRCLQGSVHIWAGKAKELGCPWKELTLMWTPWCAHALPFFAENSEMATPRESRLRFWMCSSSSPSGLVVEKYHVLGGRQSFQATIACWRVSPPCHPPLLKLSHLSVVKLSGSNNQNKRNMRND